MCKTCVHRHCAYLADPEDKLRFAQGHRPVHNLPTYGLDMKKLVEGPDKVHVRLCKIVRCCLWTGVVCMVHLSGPAV